MTDKPDTAQPNPGPAPGADPGSSPGPLQHSDAAAYTHIVLGLATRFAPC